MIICPEPQTPMAFPEQLSADQRDQFITFDQVSFSYPTRPQQSSLDQFSVTMKQGESIAYCRGKREQAKARSSKCCYGFMIRLWGQSVLVELI
jgi:ABC-type transport system involved in Fe-S cluster assembly fused permease/ATPase subunit